MTENRTPAAIGIAMLLFLSSTVLRADDHATAEPSFRETAPIANEGRVTSEREQRTKEIVEALREEAKGVRRQLEMLAPSIALYEQKKATIRWNRELWHGWVNAGIFAATAAGALILGARAPLKILENAAIMTLLVGGSNSLATEVVIPFMQPDSQTQEDYQKAIRLRQKLAEIDRKISRYEGYHGH